VRTRVLDSWAILEWINGKQPATGTVAQLLSEAEEGQTRLLMSAINVGEVYYFLRKQGRHSLAESWRESSASFPVRIEVPSFEDILARRLAQRPVPHFVRRRVRGGVGAEIQLPAGDRRS